MNQRAAFLVSGCLLAFHPTGLLHAVLVKNVTTDTVVFYDDFEGVAASPVGFPDEFGATDDFDPMPAIGAWVIDEDRNDTPPTDVREVIQVSDFVGTTTNNARFYDDPNNAAPLTYSGAVQGSQYLRINRYKSNDQAPPPTANTTFSSALIELDLSTPGDHIHFEQMFMVRGDLSGNNLGLFTLYASDVATNKRIAGIQIDSNNDIQYTSGGSNPGNNDQDFDLVAQWTPDKWHRFEVDYVVGSTELTVTVDGNSQTFDIYDLDSASLNTVANLRIGNRSEFELLLDATPNIPEFFIDRTTGEVSMVNTSGGDSSLIAYSLTSESGALNPAAWTSIAGAYDADSNNGSNTVDPNNAWVELTDPSSRDNLSEIELNNPSGDGATLADGQVVSLGNAWIKSMDEDIKAELLLDSGVTIIADVTFLPGSGGLNQFEFGDLDFDGDFDVDDFLNKFAPNYRTDTSSFSDAERYQAGDFNGDGITDLDDYFALNNAYLLANPGAAPLAFSAIVPEPGAVALVSLIGIMASTRRTRRYQFHFVPRAFAVCCLSVVCLSSATTYAITVTNVTTGAVIFADDFEEVAAIGVGFEDDPNTTDFDPSTGGGLDWTISETDSSVDAPSMIQVTNFDGMTTSGVQYPGAIQGSNYLWINRVSDFNFLAVEPTAVQDSVGDHIHAEFMSYVRDYSGGNLGVVGVYKGATASGDRIANLGVQDNGDVTVGGLSYAPNKWQKWEIDYVVGEDAYDLTIGGVTSTDINVADAPGGPFGAFRFSSRPGVEHFIDAVPELPTVEVNRTTGEIRLINDTGVDIDLSLYQITSEAGSLNTSGWTGIGDSNWAALGSFSDELTEVHFAGKSTFGSTPVSLGNAYSTTVDAQDLAVMLQVGTTLEGMYLELGTENIVYVTGPPGLPGDFNNDSIVDAVDYAVWRTNLGGDEATLGGNGSGNGTVGSEDFDIWLNNYGSTLETPAASIAVPEPEAFALFALVGIGFALMRRGLAISSAPVVSLALVGLMATTSSAAVTVDGVYRFGDLPEELSFQVPIDGQLISRTFEDVDLSADLLGGGTGPLYADLNLSPFGAGKPNDVQTWGAQFDGVDDVLQDTSAAHVTAIDSTGAGVSMWVHPNSTSSRQALFYNETNDVGIAITSDGMWTQIAAGHDEADFTPTTAVTGGAWTHIMQHTFSTGAAGAPTVVPGTGDGADDFISVLYINGVAVSAHIDDHAITPGAALLVGAENPDEPTSYFTGAIGHMELHSGDGFNLFTDNPIVVSQIATLSSGAITDGAIATGDVNVDGSVDQDDVDAFVAGWFTKNRIDGFHGDLYVPDLTTWQAGDLDQNGQVNLTDAFLLHEALAPIGGLDFSLLIGAPVPEPSVLVLMSVALIGFTCRRK